MLARKVSAYSMLSGAFEIAGWKDQEQHRWKKDAELLPR
jgi:hypothetical protein